MKRVTVFAYGHPVASNEPDGQSLPSPDPFIRVNPTKSDLKNLKIMKLTHQGKIGRRPGAHGSGFCMGRIRLLSPALSSLGEARGHISCRGFSARIRPCFRAIGICEKANENAKIKPN